MNLRMWKNDTNFTISEQTHISFPIICELINRVNKYDPGTGLVVP